MPRFRAVAGSIVLAAATLALLACSDSTAPVFDDPHLFVAASAGSDHTCGVTGNGGLLCWGRNRNGQLGDGSTEDRNVPTAVAGLPPVAAVSAGVEHTCAVTTDGVAYCWGNAYWGALGIGGSASDPQRERPSQVATTARFTSIAAGVSHTCALDAEGRAWCWGSSPVGAVGAAVADSCGPLPCSRIPVAVEGGVRFTTIAAGASWTCAIAVDGDLYCWGGNKYGELGSVTGETCDVGSGDPVACASSPARVPAGHRWAAVSTGFQHTCAVSDVGTAYCWGRRHGGLLGDGIATYGEEFRVEPAPISGGRTYTGISAGDFRTCAIAATGETFCWGRRVLGDGSSVDSAVPIAVATSVHFVTVAVGDDHTCGFGREGVMYCWGSNAYGQLGDGSHALGWSVPVAVKGW